MRFPRSAGVLLHISSLPGRFGIGDLGNEAFRFVDYLAEAGQSFWQILPLGPSDHGNPYVAQSSWAGSPFLISLEELAVEGDLTVGDLDSARRPHDSRIDYDAVAESRRRLLPLAAGRFFARADRAQLRQFEQFCADQAWWLEDWALYAAARGHLERRPWWEWPAELALRTPEGLDSWGRRLADAVRVEKYVQFRFFEQWVRVRNRAREEGVRLIGDVPFYCARDSADVWASRDMFQLDAHGNPEVVSGTPPDYYSKHGQRWGTPVYRWERHRETGYAWWIARFRGALMQADVVRIDHFRAFESYWEIPGDAPATQGRWVKGPGDGLFARVREALGDAPFVAEDLGLITRPVRDLRDRWELPGMRVLHFAFLEGAGSPHLPIWYPRNCVVYTGTHDNDTTVGWYASATEKERDAFRRWTATDGSHCHYHMIRIAYGSVADLAVVPLQDVLGLDTSARVNVPGLAEGNWRWKLLPEQVEASSAAMIRGLAELYGRLPGQKQAIDED